MKKLMLFFTLIFLVSCSNYSARKDLSQNITFENNLLPGEYHLNLISLDYPDTYKEKMAFYKELDMILKHLNSTQKSSINLLLTKEMKKDFDSLISSKQIVQENLAMKNIRDLNSDEISFLNSLNIKTADDFGTSQKLLNKQYFLLLELLEKSSLYNEHYPYTELDKNLLMKTIFTDRNFLVENLKMLKKNFVYDSSIAIGELPIFIDEKSTDFSNLNSRVVFKPSQENSGFTVLKNTLLIYVGDNKNISNANTKYRLFSELYKIKTPKELMNNSLLVKTTGVSKILNWKRDSYKKFSTDNSSLENKFDSWGN